MTATVRMLLMGALALSGGAGAAAAAPTKAFVTSTPTITAAARAAKAGKLTPRPSHAELKAIWEGPGTWSQDIGRAGTYLSGLKNHDEFADPNFPYPNGIPLKPKPKAVVQTIRRELGKGRQIFGPYSICHPAGMPYILTMSGYGGWESKVGDDEIDFFYGNQLQVRRIYLDGRKHPDERTTSLYNGFSVAHWEGKTMVVETTNIRGSNTQIEPYVPKAEGSYIVERYTPVSPGRIDLEMTMMNPDFTRPWVVKLKLTKDPKGAMIEALCSDDNRWVYANGELVQRGAQGKLLEKAED